MTQNRNVNQAVRAANARRLWDVALQQTRYAGFDPVVNSFRAEFYPDAPKGGIAYTEFGAANRDDPPAVVANTGSAYWDDPERMLPLLRASDLLHQHTPQGSLLHELGHVLFEPAGRKVLADHHAGRIRPPYPWRELPYIAEHVSPYATTHPVEFVAEVFAGLMEGTKFDAKVMTLYHWLGGKDTK